MAQVWKQVVGAGAVDGERALEVLARLVGPTHRLAWLGPDEEGHRARLAQRFGDALQALSTRGADERRTAALADWWTQATRGVSALGLAWRVRDELPEWLGAPLLKVVEAAGEQPGLVELHRPLRFAGALERLRSLLEQPAKLNKKPAPQIYGDARDDCWTLVHAADNGEAQPPRDLKILDADCGDWASEPVDHEQLLHGVKVWNTLVRHLTTLQAASRELVACWTTESRPRAALPEGWSARLDEVFGSGAGLAAILLYDAARLSDDVERPVELSARWQVEQLREPGDDLDLHDRVRLLGVVGEALDAEPALAAPDWAADARRELERLRGTVRELLARAQAAGASEAIEQLEVGLQQLDALDSREADEWIDMARQTLESRVADEEERRLTERMARLWADLQGVGAGGDAFAEVQRLFATGPASDAGEVRQRYRKVEALWSSTRADMEERRAVLARELRLMTPSASKGLAEAAMGRARDALDADGLAETSRALSEVQQAVDAARRAEEERFGPLLRRLADKVDGAPLKHFEQEAAQRAVARVRARAEADLPYSILAAELERLLEVLEQDERARALPVVCIVTALDPTGGYHLSPTCWAGSGVDVDGKRLSPTGYIHAISEERRLSIGAIVLAGGAEAKVDSPKPDHELPMKLKTPPDLPPRDRWLRVESVDSVRDFSEEQLAAGRDLALDARPFFVRDGEHVQGPYTWRRGALAPADERGFAAEMTESHFEELYGLISALSLPALGGRPMAMVHDPPSLDEMMEEGAEPVDVYDAVSLETWLSRRIADHEAVDPRVLAELLVRVEEEQLPRESVERRIRALRRVLETARLLEDERQRAAEQFLATEEGQREIDRAARRAVDKEKAAVDRHIEAYRVQQEQALTGLGEQLEAAEQRLATLREEESRIRAEREERLADLEAQVAAAEEIMADTRLRFLARVLGGSVAATGGAGHPAEPRPAAHPQDAEPVLARPFTGRPVPSLRDLVDELTERMQVWSAHDVANLVASLLSGPWTLLAGPPGVGKSTLARALLNSLGHGPRTDRALELVVRRDWQDDAALFGFWHPQRRAWEPGSEGLLELLLRAADDQRRGLSGLYTVLLEELNLAPPEYYLSRLISALEARQPEVGLYAPELKPMNGQRYPARFPIGSNVRLLGTVNIDETVERLSPRFLSRASVVWVDPRVESILASGTLDIEPGDAVQWTDVQAQLAGAPDVDLGPLADIIRFLHDRQVPGAPSPRTVQAVRRYLAASRDILPDTVAQDYQVLQRILPSFRGIGPVYREVLDELARRCNAEGLTRSAARCERLRRRGEELGDYYDFFHA